MATADIMEVSDELIADLKSPLKPVIRIATEEDVQRADELAQQGEEALVVFKESAEGASDQMRPVMVEFLFDGDKAVFYFEAEERIDFRDLVRKLAGHFHVRVDMRQIGVRDGARYGGWLGPLRPRALLQAFRRRVLSCIYPYGKGAESVAQPSKNIGMLRQAHVLLALRV